MSTINGNPDLDGPILGVDQDSYSFTRMLGSETETEIQDREPSFNGEFPDDGSDGFDAIQIPRRADVTLDNTLGVEVRFRVQEKLNAGTGAAFWTDRKGVDVPAGGSATVTVQGAKRLHRVGALPQAAHSGGDLTVTVDNPRV
jgi:hypothetical protein